MWWTCLQESSSQELSQLKCSDRNADAPDLIELSTLVDFSNIYNGASWGQTCGCSCSSPTILHCFQAFFNCKLNVTWLKPLLSCSFKTQKIKLLIVDSVDPVSWPTWIHVHAKDWSRLGQGSEVHIRFMFDELATTRTQGSLLAPSLANIPCFGAFLGVWRLTLSLIVCWESWRVRRALAAKQKISGTWSTTSNL